LPRKASKQKRRYYKQASDIAKTRGKTDHKVSKQKESLIDRTINNEYKKALSSSKQQRPCQWQRPIVMSAGQTTEAVANRRNAKKTNRNFGKSH